MKHTGFWTGFFTYFFIINNDLWILKGQCD